MALAVLLLLGLFWSLVHSQRVPYVSFMDQTLPNHSYVDLSLVGNDLSGNSVQCITDLGTCCSSTDGFHRGDWYFPDGTRLPFSGRIYEHRGHQRVYLGRRNNPTSPVGIYRCDIPTIAVYDNDISVRDTVYVGLYTGSGGDVTIPGGVTYDFYTKTLTCISTGGPATTVTWTRDSTTVTQGAQTVLNDPVTAQYTHTLTVTTGGVYTCTVANNKPSNASARITLPAALVVGLERTSYTVSESEEAVEICITAVGVNTPCPSTQSFQVTFSTTDGSAVSPSDYEAVREVLTFAPCETRHCVNVSITDDLVNEPEETFSISLNKLTSFVTLNTTVGEVLITDDDDKPEEVRFLPVNATAVRISWSGSVHLPTSIIYTVYCSTNVVRKNERVYPPGVTSVDIVLEDDIILTCTSYVHNFTLYYSDVIPSPGSNPSTLTTFTFDIDKVYLQIQFGPFYYCLSWEFKKVAAIIERELQSYVVEIIRNSCSECYNLTQSFFRKGVFVCHGNPTKTTYRTTLVNPFPTTNSTYLVGIIQSWVSTGPSLILDGLLVRVSPSCPTSISSLDEVECETGTRHDQGLGERITQTLNGCALRNLGEDVCRLGGC